MKEGHTMTTTTRSVASETWFGCYDQGWQEGELVADAFSQRYTHPMIVCYTRVYEVSRNVPAMPKVWECDERSL